MSKVPQHIIDNLKEHGIVPGAIVACIGSSMDIDAVPPTSEWEYDDGDVSFTSTVCDYGRIFITDGRKYARVVTPVKEEGLMEGDAVNLEGMPRMREAIIEFARVLGIPVDEMASTNEKGNPSIQWCGMGAKELRGIVGKSGVYWWDNSFTKECSVDQFIAKMRITATAANERYMVDGVSVKHSKGSVEMDGRLFKNETIIKVAANLI